MVEVQTLKSICMEKVNNLRSGGMQLSNVPKELLKDLDLALFFNGTYTHKVEGEFSTKSRALSIFYDGTTWTFGYRILTAGYNVGVPPTVKNSKVKLNHDETVGASYPLFDIKELMKIVFDMSVNGDDEAVTPPTNLYMKIKIQVSLQDQDYKVGRVLFFGQNFKFIWRINVDVNGSKFLSHHGVVQKKTDLNYHDFLLDSMWFEKGNEQIVEGPTKELMELKIDEDIENEYNFFDPEMYIAWEVITEGAFNDFWKLVQDEE